MVLNEQSKGTAPVDPDAWILLPFSIKCTSFYQNNVLKELFEQHFKGKKKKQRKQEMLKSFSNYFFSAQKII